DVPGQRHGQDDEEPGDDLELDDLADDPQEAREEVFARARRGQVRERHEDGQAEARGPLAERRDGGEKPRGQVREAPHAALAPARVEDGPEQRGPEDSLHDRLEAAEETEEDAAERVGVRAGGVRDARGLRDAAVFLAGPAAVAAARAAPELVPVLLEAVGAGPPEERDVARDEIEDLRERADEDRSEDEVPRRQAKTNAPDLHFVRARLAGLG